MGDRLIPEYTAISSNRVKLESLLKSKPLLVSVCDKLRDKEILSKEQSTAIKEKGESSGLVEELLTLIEFDPEPAETFIEIVYLLKQIDNKIFRRFVKKKLKLKQKKVTKACCLISLVSHFCLVIVVYKCRVHVSIGNLSLLIVVVASSGLFFFIVFRF